MDRKSRFVLSGAALSAVLLAAGMANPALAQAPKAPALETSIDGVTAEVVEAVRKEGVLTIKLRYRNAGSAPAKVKFAGLSSDVDKYYVVAGSTKLLPLKDSKGVAVMNPLDHHGQLNAEIKPNGSFLFWAKYPAPPESARKISIYTPHGPPLEDVPITEAK